MFTLPGIGYTASYPLFRGRIQESSRSSNHGAGTSFQINLRGDKRTNLIYEEIGPDDNMLEFHLSKIFAAYRLTIRISSFKTLLFPNVLFLIAACK